MFYFLMLLFLISIFIGTFIVIVLTFNKLYYIIDTLIIIIIFLMRYLDTGLSGSIFTIANYYPNFVVLRSVIAIIVFAIKLDKRKIIKLSNCSIVHICLMVINIITNLIMFIYFFNIMSLFKK
jgi:hypothetical protein